MWSLFIYIAKAIEKKDLSLSFVSQPNLFGL